MLGTFDLTNATAIGTGAKGVSVNVCAEYQRRRFRHCGHKRNEHQTSAPNASSGSMAATSWATRMRVDVRQIGGRSILVRLRRYSLLGNGGHDNQSSDRRQHITFAR